MHTNDPLANRASPDSQADAQAVMEHVLSGKPLDPAIAARIHARARQITERIQRAHGVQDIGVEILRELRGELPKP
jgi:hypothetical protein